MKFPKRGVKETLWTWKEGAHKSSLPLLSVSVYLVIVNLICCLCAFGGSKGLAWAFTAVPYVWEDGEKRWGLRMTITSSKRPSPEGASAPGCGTREHGFPLAVQKTTPSFP